MSLSPCLFIIDHSLHDPKINHYFTQFDYRIIHYPTLEQLNETPENPLAILINWQLLKTTSVNLKTLTDNFHTPLIIISDAPNDNMSIEMLENGADDFIVKPINPRELHARITAINRRIQKSLKNQGDEKEVLAFNNWHLYPGSHQLFNDKNEELKLSASEYNLLLTFLRQPQQVLGREFLLQLTKNSDLNPLDRRIDIQISRLRQKIENNTKKPLLIKTVRNGGYIFTAQVFPMKCSQSNSKDSPD